MLFLVQVAIAHRFRYRLVSFDLLYILAAYLALEASRKGALWGALGIGILRDLASCGRLGGSAVILVVGTAGILSMRDRVYRETVAMDLLLVFAFLLFCGFSEVALVVLAASDADKGVLAGRALGQALLTTALTPLFFLLYERIGLIERDESLFM